MVRTTLNGGGEFGGWWKNEKNEDAVWGRLKNPRDWQTAKSAGSGYDAWGCCMKACSFDKQGLAVRTESVVAIVPWDITGIDKMQAGS